MEIIKHFKRGSGDRIITRNVFVYAIRNAIRISKCAYPTAKKVIFKREDVEVEISEMETESSLYEKFKEKQRIEYGT